MIILDILFIISIIYLASALWNLANDIDIFRLKTRRRVGFRTYRYEYKNEVNRTTVIIVVSSLIIFLVRLFLLNWYPLGY